jgi:hypothetical protein
VVQSEDVGFTPRECERIYRNMILGELRNGPLSAVRRARLLHYAAKLRLSPAEAAQLMDEARAAHERASEAQPASGLQSAGEGMSAHVRILIGVGLLAAIAAIQYASRLYLSSR